MSALEIPLFPLSTVLFPEGVLSLRVFEPRYLEMVSQCLRGNYGFGAVLIREGKEVGKAAVPHDVGTLARIHDWHRGADGLLGLVAVGERRIRIRSQEILPSQLIMAHVEPLPVDPPIELPAEYEVLVEGLRRILHHLGAPYTDTPTRFDDAGWVSSRLAEFLPLPWAAKQALLEMDEPMERVHFLSAWLLSHGKEG